MRKTFSSLYGTLDNRHQRAAAPRLSLQQRRDDDDIRAQVSFPPAYIALTPHLVTYIQGAVYAAMPVGVSFA